MLTFSPVFRAITPDWLKGGRLLQLLDGWGFLMQKALSAPQDNMVATRDRVKHDMEQAWNALLPLVDPGENWQFRTSVDGLTQTRATSYASGSTSREDALKQALSDLDLALHNHWMGPPVPGEPPHGLQDIELVIVQDDQLGPRFEARDMRPPARPDGPDEKQLSIIAWLVIGGVLGIAAILGIFLLVRKQQKRRMTR